MKRTMVLVSLMVIALAGVVWAQQGAGWGRGMGRRGQQMYDPSKAETISGEVVAVKEFTSPNGMHKGIGLTLNTDGQTQYVHLGPQFYVEKQAVKLASGDRVEVTGVKTSRMGQDFILAGEVKKGSDVLKLRDENGRPLWRGAGPGPARMQQQKAPMKAPVGC